MQSLPVRTGERRRGCGYQPCSLAGEGAAAYSLARVAAAVTAKSGGGSVLSGMRGKATADSPRVGRENSETVAKR